MTSIAMATSRKAFDLIYAQLHVLVHAGKIDGAYMFGSFDERISVDTGLKGREIRLVFYRDSGRFSVQLWGIWLMGCKVISTKQTSYMRPDGTLTAEEALWDTHTDAEAVAAHVLGVVEHTILPMYLPVGNFKQCNTCEHQLACLGRAPLAV